MTVKTQQLTVRGNILQQTTVCTVYKEAMKGTNVPQKQKQTLQTKLIAHTRDKDCIYSLDWTTRLEYLTGLLD